MSDSQIRALQGYVELLNTNALAHIVRAANAAGIIDALADGQKQIDEIAARCQLNRQALEHFMPALTQTPLVEQYGEYYALSQVARMIPPELADLGDTHWQHLGKFLRSGSALPKIPNLAATDDDYLATSLSQEWLQTPAAISAATALDIGRHRKGMRVLEIGCGSAVFSLTFAHKDPTSRFFLVDSMERLELARRGADSLQLDERIEFIVEDYLQYQAEPKSIDLVLVAALIHRHSDKEVQQIIRRAAAALKPGGEFCIVDVFPGQDRGDRFRSIFDLELAMRSTTGQLHSVFLIQEWLRESGFADIQFTHLPAPPYLWGLLIAPHVQSAVKSDPG